ncbi:MAG: hypothetical protein ACYC69_06775 [Thermodesulfovibrionales bacterium]
MKTLFIVKSLLTSLCQREAVALRKRFIIPLFGKEGKGRFFGKGLLPCEHILKVNIT